MDTFNILAILKPQDSSALEMDSFTNQRIGICDLPEEVLEIIFDYLGVSDLKNASLVCRQWSRLAFFGRRMDRVWLNVDNWYKRPHRTSQRQFRHIMLCKTNSIIDGTFITCLQSIKNFVVSVDGSYIENPSQLVHILPELPKLKAIKLDWSDDLRRFPVIQQIALPAIRSLWSSTFKNVDICSMAPNLQKIVMDCDSEYALKVYRHFGHQLKSIEVYFGCPLGTSFVRLFSEIVFPELRDITIYYIGDGIHSAFLAGSKQLHRASLHHNVTQKMLNCLMENCRDITFLAIHSQRIESLSLMSNLTKLKTLHLCGRTYDNVFEKCKPIPSLKELKCLGSSDCNRLEFFKGLATIMPNISKLILRMEHLDENCLQCICNNFVLLRYLEIASEIADHNGWLQYLDRLPNLVQLNLIFDYFSDNFFQSVPSNKINKLSIASKTLNDNHLLVIPEVFPSLHKLKIYHDAFMTDGWAAMDKLRSALPGCMIISIPFDHKFIDCDSFRP